MRSLCILFLISVLLPIGAQETKTVGGEGSLSPRIEVGRQLDRARRWLGTQEGESIWVGDSAPPEHAALSVIIWHFSKGLRPIVDLEKPPEDIIKACRFLESQQAADGGVGAGGNRTRTTARSVFAWLAAREFSVAANKGGKFLSAQKKADGSYGDVVDTVLVLEILNTMEDRAVVAFSVDAGPAFQYLNELPVSEDGMVEAAILAAGLNTDRSTQALTWLEKHYSPKSTPGVSADDLDLFHLLLMQGLAPRKKPMLGEEDWRQILEREVIERQTPEGYWKGPDGKPSYLHTSYAVLTLQWLYPWGAP